MSQVKFLKYLDSNLYVQHDQLNDELTIRQLTISDPNIAPFIINSTQLVANLNADLLDGKNASDFVLADGSNPMISTLDMNGHRIINLGTPVNGSDAVTKDYVDSMSAGLDPKASVRVASTGSNIDLTGGTFSGVLDGITLADGDRVLIKDQTDSKENGIYVYDATNKTFTRAADMDGTPSNEVSAGNYTFVEAGNTYAGSGWVVLGDGELTVGTDDIVWSQFSGAGQINAGVALEKNGSTFNVKFDDTTIGVNGSNELEVKDNAISSSKLADNSVISSKILDGAVSASKLNSDVAGSAIELDGTTNAINVKYDNTYIGLDVNGKLTIIDGSIDGTKLSTGSITANKLDSSVAGEGLVLNSSTNALDVNVDSTYLEIVSDELTIKDSSINTSKLVNGAVTNLKLDDGAVTTTKILDGAIIKSKLASNSVGEDIIDFGSGSDQVDATSIPLDSTGSYNGTASNVQDALEELEGKVGSGEYFKTFSTSSGDVVADGSADTVTFSSTGTISISGNDTTDTLTFDIADSAITADKLASNIDASSKGFNADKVDGKDASAFLWISGGNNTMAQDLDMGGYNITNVGNSSITFQDGSKIISAKFDTSGNIDAHTLEGATLDDSSIVPVSNTIFTSEQVAKRIDKFARNFRIEFIIDGNTLPTTSTEGVQGIIDPDNNNPPSGFSAGDIIEYRNGAWTVLGNIADSPFAGSFLYAIVDDTLNVVTSSGEIVEITNENSDFNATNITYNNTNELFSQQYLEDPNNENEGILKELSERNALIMTVESGYTINDGTAVIVNANGNIEPASNVYSDDKYKVIGIAKWGADSSHKVVVFDGIFEVNDILNGIGNVGDTIYLGSNGTFTATAPTTSGEIVMKLGTKLSDDKLFVQIEKGVVLS